MNIEEFQAKQLLRAYAIPTPRGEIADDAKAAQEAGRQLGGDKWMVKAQICAGGRGRGTFIDSGNSTASATTGPAEKSGIRIATSPEQIHAHAADMLGKSLVTAQTGADGLPVRRVYVEEAVVGEPSEREVALSVLVDERHRCISVLLFAHAGGGIEEAAAADPDSVQRIPASLRDGVDAARLRAATEKLGLAQDPGLRDELEAIVGKAVRLFCDKDARLVEINPLAARAGKWLALDAKMAFDTNALFRQDDIHALENATGGHRLVTVAGFNYIPLDGDIACLSVGAGLAMATLDAVRECGGRPAYFLDLPPGVKVNRVVGAIEALLAAPQTRALLINVFGGGIMRCDLISDALLLVNHTAPISTPLIVRLSGTNAELANRRLHESMPGAVLVDDMAQAARAAVAAISGGAGGPGGPVKPRSWWRSWLARTR